MQEINLIVTIKQSKEVLFQIAPIAKEKLQKVKGLQIGKPIFTESGHIKCKNCADQVKVNLFWTKSMVVIGNSPPKLEKQKANTQIQKEKSPVKVEIVEIKTEVLHENQTIKEVKQEKIEEDFEETEDNFTFEDIQRSESEASEYEIPKWCAPKPPSKRIGRPKENPHILCHICSKNIRRDMLNDHMFKHEFANSRPYECNECGKSFSRVNSLQDHLIQKHFTSLAKFLCPHCPSVFSRNCLLQKHLYDRHRIGKSQSQTCPHCNLVLSNKGTLKSHITNMHTDPSQKKVYLLFQYIYNYYR